MQRYALLLLACGASLLLCGLLALGVLCWQIGAEIARTGQSLRCLGQLCIFITPDAATLWWTS
jgi:hypothetical protein